MFDDDPRGETSSGFEELAEVIRLVTGDIRVTVSEAKAVKIEARQHVKVWCAHRKENSWVASADDLELVIRGAPKFVMRRLESLIVSLVGSFGYVEAQLEEGHVKQLRVNAVFRPPGDHGPSRASR